MLWFLVKITKNEAQILNVKYEIPFKEFGGITRTCSCHHKRKTYYLTESNYNLNALSEIRKNIVEWQNIYKKGGTLPSERKKEKIILGFLL